MIQTIPENMYESFEIGELRITGYKSGRIKWNKDFVTGKIDPDGVHLSFNEGSFSFGIGGKENLEKLKEVIEFALKIENEEIDINKDKRNKE